MKLDDRQYRIRNTTLDEVEALLMEFGRKVAEQERKTEAETLALYTACDIDALVLGNEDQVPSLDARWNDLHRTMVEIANSPVEGDDFSTRVVFDIFPLQGDALLYDAMDDMYFRDLWIEEPRIERYGKAMTPYDQGEYDRRVADWNSVREGRRVVAYDGIIERPDLEAIRDCLPSLKKRAALKADFEVQREEAIRLAGVGFAPKDPYEIERKAWEYRKTDAGKTQVELARLNMLKILPPEITDSMLIHGMPATPTISS